MAKGNKKTKKRAPTISDSGLDMSEMSDKELRKLLVEVNGRKDRGKTPFRDKARPPDDQIGSPGRGSSRAQELLGANGGLTYAMKGKGLATAIDSDTKMQEAQDIIPLIEVDISTHSQDDYDNGEDPYSNDGFDPDDVDSDIDDTPEALRAAVERTYNISMRGDVVTWRKMGPHHAQCLVRYGATGAPTYRLVPASSMGSLKRTQLLSYVQRLNEAQYEKAMNGNEPKPM